MTTRTALLTLVLLAGCATASPEPAPSATSAPAPSASTTASAVPSSEAAATADAAVSDRPSDWALTVVGTPFVLAFRAVICTASVVVAGPTAALFAVSDDPRGGFDYLRAGLAQNCGPPYAVPIPVIGAATEPDVVYPAEPDLDQPRRLTPYSGAAPMSP
ncbi:MAG: hypothetical protein ACREJ5_22230 [Geminicoccaceae bacterium]